MVIKGANPIHILTASLRSEEPRMNLFGVVDSRVEELASAENVLSLNLSQLTICPKPSGLEELIEGNVRHEERAKLNGVVSHDRSQHRLESSQLTDIKTDTVACNHVKAVQRRDAPYIHGRVADL